MAVWSAFVELAFKANKAHKAAISSAEASEQRVEELSTEYANLSRDEEGLSLQLADRRKVRESGPIHTAPGRYSKYLRRRRV